MRTFQLIFLLVGLAFSGCAESHNEPKTWDVKYAVEGTGLSFNVTISNKDEGTSQFSNVNRSWTHLFTTQDSDHFLYISAQNNSDYGNVTVKIYVDGVKKKESTSEGAYVIASASMIVDD